MNVQTRVIGVRRSQCTPYGLYTHNIMLCLCYRICHLSHVMPCQSNPLAAVFVGCWRPGHPACQHQTAGLPPNCPSLLTAACAGGQNQWPVAQVLPQLLCHMVGGCPHGVLPLCAIAAAGAGQCQLQPPAAAAAAAAAAAVAVAAAVAPAAAGALPAQLQQECSSSCTVAAEQQSACSAAAAAGQSWAHPCACAGGGGQHAQPGHSLFAAACACGSWTGASTFSECSAHNLQHSPASPALSWPDTQVLAAAPAPALAHEPAPLRAVLLLLRFE